MAGNQSFVRSLAVAGESGTLVDEMRGTYAQGRCRGKSGTLQVVSNLVGYCTARDGDELAFAFMMSDINPDDAHPIQDRMALALADYNAADAGAEEQLAADAGRRRQPVTPRVPTTRSRRRRPYSPSRCS